MNIVNRNHTVLLLWGPGLLPHPKPPLSTPFYTICSSYTTMSKTRVWYQSSYVGKNALCLVHLLSSHSLLPTCLGLTLEKISPTSPTVLHPYTLPCLHTAQCNVIVCSDNSFPSPRLSPSSIYCWGYINNI